MIQALNRIIKEIPPAKRRGELSDSTILCYWLRDTFFQMENNDIWNAGDGNDL